MQYTIDTSPLGQLSDMVQHVGPGSVALVIGALFVIRAIYVLFVR
jgi:hypothetical protein